MEENKIIDILKESIDDETLMMLKSFGLDENSMAEIINFFLLDDEQFVALSPFILTELTKELNRDKNAIANSLKEQGISAEDWNKIKEDFLNILKDANLTEVKIEFINYIFEMIEKTLTDVEYTELVTVPIVINENGKMPLYAHDGDAGADIFAAEDVTLAPGEQKIVKTGTYVAIPKGYAILVQPRSGLSAKTKLRVANTPGLIDSNYRGEIGVILENVEPPIKNIEYTFNDEGIPLIKSILHGQSYSVEKGDRIAQLRLVKVPTIAFSQVENLDMFQTDRDTKGFGSSGTK